MINLLEHIKKWSTIPHTDPKAKAVEWKDAPENRKVLVAEIASIRNATIHNQKFLIAEGCEPKEQKDGSLRIEVECLWYDNRPRTTWMHIKIQSGRFQIKNSTGDKVVKNIAR